MTDNEAKDAVKTIMKDRKFGKAGDEIVIEEFLEGEELSLFAVTDGKEYRMLPSAQDHKAVFDDDKGPNTGGMGAYAPAPVATPELMMKIEKSIIKPVIKAMAKEGCPYKGLLYAGLMITKKGPKVIEFNCRFGDPETQVILPLLKSDFLMLLNAAVEGQLEDQNVDFNHKCAAGVMLASGGYPGPYETGKEIFGFSHLIMNRRKIIFHSGTELRDGTYYTNGGRVICMTSVHFGLREAINEAYEMVDDIHFLNKHFRNDIGKKALERLT